jgi:hypothetical protein
MRSSTHRLKCSICPARIELTMDDTDWHDDGQKFVNRIAEVKGWAMSPVKCRTHATKEGV